MKKTIITAIVLSSALMMTGCGHDTDDSSSAGATGTSASTEATASSETSDTSAA